MKIWVREAWLCSRLVALAGVALGFGMMVAGVATARELVREGIGI